MVVKEETALHSLKLAKKHNLLTIFNFAPANKDLSPDFNKLVDILIVNEVEVRKPIFSHELMRLLFI